MPDFNVILFLDDATITEVLEETYHALQDRKGMFSNYPKDEILPRREIDAQHYLLNVQKKYKIPIEEIEEIEQNLMYWESQLEKIKGEK